MHSRTFAIAAFLMFVLFLYYSSNGSEYTAATNATLRFTLLNSTLPPQDLPMTQLHGYHFYIDQSPVLSQPGVWKVGARISRTIGPDVTATFHIPVGTAG